MEITEFSTISIDAPLPETGGGKIKRGCDRHYPVIKTKHDILRTIVQAPVWRPTRNCHLYFWSTSNYESWVHWIIDALGFKHIVTIPWVKPGNAGLGQYFRGAHEPLMFAVKGSGPALRTEAKGLRTDALVGASRPVDGNGKRIHSAKPDRAYELIEARSKGPFLDMFARRPREGWTVWGNEIEDKKTAPARAGAVP